MLVGNLVSLRALEESDLSLLQGWRNNEDFRKYFREYRELNLEDQKQWFWDFVIKDRSTLMFGIVETASDQLIGVCGLCYINWVHRHADISLYIGKDSIYIDTKPQGYVWSSLDILLQYAFNTLNIHKVWSELYSFDHKKQELYSNYGFKIDATLRDNYFYEGKYQDSFIYSLLESEWRQK